MEMISGPAGMLVVPRSHAVGPEVVMLDTASSHVLDEGTRSARRMPP